MALMGLQCFKELFPFCKNNFWGQEEFMWPREYSWLVQHLQLSTPWFNLECFFLGSFCCERDLSLCAPICFMIELWMKLQLPSCVMSSQRILFEGSCFVHVQWTRLTLLVTEYLGCGLAGYRLAHGAPFMSTVEQKVEIFAHLYIVLNFHMFEFMGI